MKLTNSTIHILTLVAASAGIAHAQSTQCVSVTPAGIVGNGDSVHASISADGRFVTFSSAASNLVAGDTSVFDVFVRDIRTGQTACVSVDPSGAPGNGESFRSTISADGNRIAFASDATNLVAGDTNSRTDAFVRDLSTGTTIRVSVSSSGTQGNNASSEGDTPAISADGRYVAFVSTATNLVPGGGNPVQDMLVHDLLTGQTTRASVSSSGAQANSNAFNASISGDGRYVAFDSYASNLVIDDTNGESDVFVHDNLTGQTKRVSVNSSGAQSQGYSVQPSISADGRFVAFSSGASDLVPNDTNMGSDVFVHDLFTGRTIRVNVDSNGAQAAGFSLSYAPSISADGRFVAFGSNSRTLVPGDSNGSEDVFVRDLLTGQTTRASVDSFGFQADFDSTYPSISADGRYVAFDSAATNLVPGDGNNRIDIFRRDRMNP